MTFRDQVRWCRVWGLRLVVVGLLGLAVVVLVTADSLRGQASVVAAICNLTAFAGVALVVFGALFRPWQKRLYHALMEPNDLFRAWVVAVPGLTWFLWITAEGRNRDA